jgi:hypothetical protein
MPRRPASLLAGGQGVRSDPEAVKALIVANGFLETQLDELKRKVSTGYVRGRPPRAGGRKDEADV